VLLNVKRCCQPFSRVRVPVISLAKEFEK